MKPLRERINPLRRAVAGSAFLALVLTALLAIAASAQAAELLYWDNFSGKSADSISVANVDGSGGGSLNLTGAELTDPEGMAIDSVTGRLFVAGSNSGPGEIGQILFANLDGSGAGVFSAPGAPVEEPLGVALDPNTRTIYWVNSPTGPDSIAWAKLDGSAGGLLNTTGATLEGAYKIAVDPVHGRVYWANTEEVLDTISYANVDNSGGGNLDLTGATPPKQISALAVDPAAGRIYWLDNEVGRISFASLSGGGGGDVNTTGATFDDPFGLAFDPTIQKFYWGNYEHKEERTNAIGFANLAGGGGAITPTDAPVAGPQDPLILKSPSGTAAPQVTRSKKNRAALSCSSGSWASDFPGSFVYQAPHTLGYQWTRNGKPVSGASAATFTAKSQGKYACVVTATNQAGSSSQTSASAKVEAAKLKLNVKKGRAEAGGVATFKVKLLNQGDIKSKKAQVCAQVPKKAQDDLKARKCSKLAALAGRAKRTVKVKVKVFGSAEGTYKLTFKPKGVPGKPAKGKLLVH